MTTRSGFDEQLADLQREILRMGTVVGQALDKAVRSLQALDGALAREVIAEDDRIDEMVLRMGHLHGLGPAHGAERLMPGRSDSPGTVGKSMA